MSSFQKEKLRDIHLMQASGAVFAGEEPEEDDFEEETPDQEIQPTPLTYQATQPTSTATVLQGEEAEEDEASIDEGMSYIFISIPFVYFDPLCVFFCIFYLLRSTSCYNST